MTTHASTSAARADDTPVSGAGTRKTAYYRFKPWNIGRVLIWTLFALSLIIAPLVFAAAWRSPCCRRSAISSSSA